jgi:DNA-binding MarR family transcriptional regulator
MSSNVYRVDEIDRIVGEWNRERPDLDVSPTHTLQRITRLGLLQAASFARVFAPYGVSFGEYLVLAALRRAGPPYRMSPTALFNAVILSSGAMTNRLDRLEEMGFVERVPDPTDRRGRLVALTERGRELVDAAAVDHLENEQRLLASLDAGEREQLAGLLRKLLLSEPFRELDPAAARQEIRSGRAPSRASRSFRAAR